MAHMTFDWLTARLLRPMLQAHGLRLADFASSLRVAAGNYETVDTKLGRPLRVAGFRVGGDHADGHSTRLEMPGSDPFMSMLERAPFPQMPLMWGSLSKDVNEEYRIHMDALVLDPNLIYLGTAGGGMMLFRATLPDTLLSALAGERFSKILSHPATNSLRLHMRRVRPAQKDELQNVREFGRLNDAWNDMSISTPMVATFNENKTPYRVPFDI